MKTSAFVIATCVASASAFSPQMPARQSTQLAEKKSIFRTISEMDLFAPKADQNDYGARGKKKSNSVGTLSSKSYIPAGLTKEQYAKLRTEEQKKKEANYQRNVAKAGIFSDYTEFYTKRGTDSGEAWSKSVTKGHDMAKTKYDWSGAADQPLWAKSPTKKGKNKK
jgi:hypothetical protein